MRYESFENWNVSRDTLPLRQARAVDGMELAEHTDAVERAVFASVWNATRARQGSGGKLVTVQS